MMCLIHTLFAVHAASEQKARGDGSSHERHHTLLPLFGGLPSALSSEASQTLHLVIQGARWGKEEGANW